jgi:hypothetical protein
MCAAFLHADSKPPACRLGTESISESSDSRSDTSGRTMLPLDENERVLSLQMALKCADIGHLAASLEVSYLPPVSNTVGSLRHRAHGDSSRRSWHAGGPSLYKLHA